MSRFHKIFPKLLRREMRLFTFPEDQLPKMWEISEIFFYHYFISHWYTNRAVPHFRKIFLGSSQEKWSQEIFESALCQHLAFSQTSGIFPNIWEIFFIPLLVQKGCSPPPEDILGKQSRKVEPRNIWKRFVLQQLRSTL